MDDAQLLDSLVADVEATANVFDTSPEAPIAACPGWTVADLVAHHGGVLRWADTIVRTGEAVSEEFAPPRGHDELRRWYVEAADGFISRVSTTDREDACWTFGRAPGRVWFWTRRQALEAAIHRWDAESAMGAVPQLQAGLAGVGIAEVVEDLFPRQVALGRAAPLSASVELRAEDVGQQWILPGQAEGRSAVVEAPAVVLLLLLWGRTGLDDPRIEFHGTGLVRNELLAARFTP